MVVICPLFFPSFLVCIATGGEEKLHVLLIITVGYGCFMVVGGSAGSVGVVFDSLRSLRWIMVVLVRTSWPYYHRYEL